MLAPGVRLNEYEVLAPLGAGGMGEVFLARDIRLGRTVALKILRVDAADPVGSARLERFATEAKAASALNHPNVASVYGIGQVESICYIAMEHIQGKTLKQVRGASPEEILDIAIQAASALEAAHTAGIIHRDIKPANIMRTESGLIKVLDFGLAKRLPREGGGVPHAEPLTGVGTVMGTLGYMSPEQLLGQDMDPRTDIFSLGVVLYQMLTGKLPFASDSYEAALAEVLGSSSAGPGVRQTVQHLPAALAPVILRCIERDRARRYESATSLIAALRAVEFSQKAPAPATSSSSRRHWMKTWATAGGAVAGLAGLAAWRSVPGAPPIPTGPMNSLAVLPFSGKNSGSSDLEYLREGIAESLMNRLSAVSGLRVMSRDSAFRHRDQEAVEAGRKLGVRGVVTGAIHALDGALLVTAELIDAASGARVWGEEFRGDSGGVLAVRDRIAVAIAGKLRGQLVGGTASAADAAAIGATAPEDPRAHDLYLRGRYHASRVDAAEIRRGISYFEQAVQIDSRYAIAHVAAAEAHILAADLFEPAQDALPLARRCAEQALANNPDLPEGHMVDGMLAMVADLDWANAEACFRKAIAVKPHLAQAHSWLGWIHGATGRTQEGLALSQRAVELEPRSPLTHATRAANLYFAGEYADAFSSAGAALEIDPQFHLALLWRGMSMIARGMPGLVAAKLEGVRKTNKTPFVTAALGRAYAAADKPAKARRLLEELYRTAATQHVSAILFAGLHASLGEKDEALAALQRAYESRSKLLLWTGRDPVFKILHREARFAALLERMHLRAA